MSLLESAEAQALLDETLVHPQTLRSCQQRLTAFLARYLPLFYRVEQAQNAVCVIEGLLSNLERKTCEPIARQHGVQRKPIQFFVGSGKWNDEAVMREMRAHAVEEFGDANGVLVFDASSFAKKGAHSCGVQRQWCGRLGKIENCQTGLFLAYATAESCAPLDRRLFLSETWAADLERRNETHVPEEIVFRKKWEMALDMLDAHGANIPHRWITADDDFGRCAEFRSQLRQRNELYVLDVPCDTLIRDLECGAPQGKRGAPFERVDAWAQSQPASRWEQFKVSDGEKGPIHVRVLRARVKARHAQRIGEAETLLVIRTVEEKPETKFAFSNAPAQTALAELVRVAAQRHRIEALFEAAKGEAGLAHYEVRSWVGWHHHMTLALLALLFLLLERNRLRKKNPGNDGATDAPDLLALAG